jgi:hypothetical protein
MEEGTRLYKNGAKYSDFGCNWTTITDILPENLRVLLGVSGK